MGQQNTKSNLFIKIILGQTQSHQLFDFQNGGNQQQQQIISKSSYIIDKGVNLLFLSQQAFQQSIDAYSNDQIIYKVNVDQYQQITIKDMSQYGNHHLWRVIKPGQCQTVKPGDMIKIGKIKLELKKIVQRRQQNVYQQETVKDINQNYDNDQLQSVHSTHSNQDRCRICFSSYSKKRDPLLCLCKCSGSIKFIHFLCLKDWISNNFSKRQDQYCKFYIYQQTACQLCKHMLPNQFKHQGKLYSFLDFTTFQPPYAQFQYSEMENGKKKYYRYIINLHKDKEVIIGRHNSSQVLMKDISISRTHCSLQYKQGLLILRDKKSKFGTLIKINNSIEFNSQSGLQLQFDSNLIQLYNNNTFKSCCTDIDSYKLIYQPNLNQNHNHQNIPFHSISNRQNYQESRNLLQNHQNYRELEVIRMDSSDRESQMHRRESQHIQQALNMEENINSPHRSQSQRATMIRQTIARDQLVRY